MARPIFRKSALDRLASPEQLDQLMQVTSPRAWIALAGLGLLLLMALLWGLLGSVSTTVAAQGVLIRQVQPLKSTHAGVVERFLVRSGDEVEKGQKLVELSRGKERSYVVSPLHAHVLQRTSKAGENVRQGASLLLLEPVDQRLWARLYVPVAEGYQVEREMSAQVWPASVKKDEFGYILGRVASAAKFPITQAEMLDRLKNEGLVRQLSAAGPCLQIIVELTPDPNTVSGYRWSSGKGAPLPLYSGTPCQAQIVISKRRPIQLVFPSKGGS
jgi:hypothetical protein